MRLADQSDSDSPMPECDEDEKGQSFFTHKHDALPSSAFVTFHLGWLPHHQLVVIATKMLQERDYKWNIISTSPMYYQKGAEGRWLIDQGWYVCTMLHHIDKIIELSKYSSRWVTSPILFTKQIIMFDFTTCHSTKTNNIIIFCSQRANFTPVLTMPCNDCNLCLFHRLYFWTGKLACLLRQIISLSLYAYIQSKGLFLPFNCM